MEDVSRSILTPWGIRIDNGLGLGLCRSCNSALGWQKACLRAGHRLGRVFVHSALSEHHGVLPWCLSLASGGTQEPGDVLKVSPVFFSGQMLSFAKCSTIIFSICVVLH